MTDLMKDLEDCHLFTSEEDVRQRMGDEFVAWNRRERNENN